MDRPPPRSTLTVSRFPDTTLFRSRRERLIPQTFHIQFQCPRGAAHLDDSVCRARTGEVVRKAHKGAEICLRPLTFTHLIPLLLDLSSEEHTSELQSLMRNSYAVFCLQKKITQLQHPQHTHLT